MGFDIMSLQKGRGPVQARSKADEGRAVLKYIDVDDLVPSEDNFYSMSAIEELAGLIELSGGVKQPALVVPLGGGKYKVIAGHRRRLASLQLVKQGKEEYRKMPCMVEDSAAGKDAEADELREIDEAILLITTNGQREKTDWDKVQEVTRLRALLDRKRKFEKIHGETRKLIAEQLGTTPAQVGRYDSIEKHLIPAFKDWLEQGKIGVSVAYELSTMPEDAQWEAIGECWKKREPVTLEDVRRWKQEAEREEPEPAADGKKYKPGVYMREETTKSQIVPPPQPVPSGGITMVTADEVGPAPTPEQMEAIAERAKDHQNSGAVVVPGSKPMKAGSEEDIWKQEGTGKVVDIPTPPSPPPAEAVPVKEPLSKKRVAYILEDLQMYCEEMLGIESERVETWAERADALTVAIAALRK